MWLGHHFQGQKVKGQLAGAAAYCSGLPHSLLLLLLLLLLLTLCMRVCYLSYEPRAWNRVELNSQVQNYVPSEQVDGHYGHVSASYQLSVDEVPWRRRMTVNSQQCSTVAPRHETKRYLVLGRRLWRLHLKHCDAQSIVAAVPVAFRLCCTNKKIQPPLTTTVIFGFV